MSADAPAPSRQLLWLPLLNRGVQEVFEIMLGTTLGTVAVQCFDTVGLVVQLNAVDNAGGSGVATLTYAATGSKPITATTVNGMSAQTTITASGLTTLSFAATDMAGNPEGTKSESVIIGFGEDRVGFGCAMPTPNFATPTHGTLAVKGTVTVYGVTYPFSKTITF